MGILLDNHLAYTISVIDGKILLAEIDKNYTHLSAIVGVNSARTVGDAYAALQSQTGPRADLAFISRRQLHVQSCMNQRPFKRLEYNRAIRKVCPHIHSSRLECRVVRKRMMTSVDYLDFNSIHNYS